MNGQSFTRNKQHKGDDGSMLYLMKQGGMRGNLPVVLAVIVIITLTLNV